MMTNYDDDDDDNDDVVPRADLGISCSGYAGWAGARSRRHVDRGHRNVIHMVTSTAGGSATAWGSATPIPHTPNPILKLPVGCCHQNHVVSNSSNTLCVGLLQFVHEPDCYIMSGKLYTAHLLEFHEIEFAFHCCCAERNSAARCTCVHDTFVTFIYLNCSQLHTSNKEFNSQS